MNRPWHTAARTLTRGSAARRFHSAASTAVLFIGMTAAAQSMWAASSASAFLAAADDPTAAQQRQIEVFGPIVLNRSDDIEPSTRQRAAEELLAIGHPGALRIIDQALRSDSSRVVADSVQAIIRTQHPYPEALEGLIWALRHTPAELHNAIAAALALYGDDARPRLTMLALDAQAPLPDRLAATLALGGFRDRGAAECLVRVLDPEVEAPPELVNAACDALDRLTGLRHGRKPEAWRGWWSEASQLPPDELSDTLLRTLGDRLTALDQELTREREVNERLGRQLHDVYRDLFPSLAIDEQFRRLPALLEHRLTPVREFALGRVALLVRDSVPIPSNVRQSVAARVDDDSPALRTRAVRLLDELNHADVVEVVARRLDQETSADVVGTLVDVLARRASVAGLPAVVRCLAQPDLAPLAADGLWRMLPALSTSESERADILAAAHHVLEPRRAPAVARLVAWLGDLDDAARLETWMDEDDDALAAAVADGFARRGLRQPVLDRAQRQAVLACAAAMLAEGPATINAFRTLVQLVPSPATQPAWQQAVGALAGRLASSDLEAADDLLAASEHVPANVRCEVLIRALERPLSELGADARHALMARAAPLLLETGQPEQASAMLDMLHATSFAHGLQVTRFRALAITGRYDEAATVSNDPRAWITLLEYLAPRDPIGASALLSEIRRRYGQVLEDEAAASLDAFDITLNSSPTGAAREVVGAE